MFSNREAFRLFSSALLAACQGRIRLPWNAMQIRSMQRKVEAFAGAESDWSQLDWNQLDLPKSYRAAGTVYSATNDLELVLDGLTSSSQIRQDLAIVTRRPFVYLAFLFGLGCMLLWGYKHLIGPQIFSSHERMKLLPASLEPLHAVSHFHQWLIWPFILGWLIVTALLLLRNTGSIAWLLGGRRYQLNREVALILQMVDRLKDAFMPKERAFELAGELSNASRASCQLALQLTPQAWTDESEASELRANIQFFRQAAASRIQALRILLPLLLVAVVGGIATFTYSVAIFLPIVSLMSDLTAPTGATWR